MRVPKTRREMLLDEWERSGGSAAQFADYVGIKYSTLASWLQKRRRRRDREKPLLKAGTDTEAGKSNGGWIEAVLENGCQPGVPAGGLRIYFTGGAHCQISSVGEAALAAELLGRLGGAKR